MAYLSNSEIHLWLVDENAADERLLASYQRLLSADEHDRLDRLHFAQDQRRFLITRAAIRSILSHYVTDVSPATWRFNRNSHGRPFVCAPELTNGLTFNIAHTQGLIAIAIAANGLLGVDVENPDRDSRTVEVADRYFSQAETSALRLLPEDMQRARFFDLWTLKEAWIKAIGTGLATPLSDFSFDIDGDHVAISFASQRHGDPSRWQFWQLQLSANHQIAIAFAGQQKMKVLTKKMVPLSVIESCELNAFRSSERLQPGERINA